MAGTLTQPLPERAWRLRPDLEIIEAESDAGRPALIVHDPQDGGFHRVEWPESDLIAALRGPLSAAALRERFAAANPLMPSLDDILRYLAELGNRGWLRDDRFWPQRHRERPRASVAALLAKTLFIQIPLIRPENFLKATAGLAGLLLNRAVLVLLVLCGLAGAYLALPRWEEYWRDSLGSFSLGTAPAFLAILILVKAAHEFAHAYTATLAGARVSSMGVALFFFVPLPFTDVTDAWRLPWRPRLRVAAAGMGAETALACLALPAWALSPPGATAEIFARLSSIAVLSTLLTNLNPGPRFDGYYILLCLFRLENLRTRGLAELRRVMWKFLFGLELPDTEPGLRTRRRAALLVYAAYSLFYRFSLGFAFALAAYHLFPKALGLPIAAVELWLFTGGSIFAETKRLIRSPRKMRPTIPLLVAAVLSAACLAWFAGSWPRRAAFPAVTRAKTEEAVRSRAAGAVANLSAAKGNRVAAGEELAVLVSPFYASSLRRAEWALVEAELAEEQAWRDAGARREAGRLAAVAERRRGELEALRRQGEYFRVVASASGSIAAWSDALRPGVSTQRGAVLGWVVEGPAATLSCYARMDQAGKLEKGAEVAFFPDSGEAHVSGRIVRIEESRPETLEDAALAGALAATPTRDGSYILREPYAKILVELDPSSLRIGQTGTVRTWTRPESLAAGAWNWLTALAARESAF